MGFADKTFTDGKCANIKKQFADQCRELGNLDPILYEMLQKGSSAGELLLRAVENPIIPLKKKVDFLFQLKPRIGL